MFSGKDLRILALYPRRPKIAQLGDSDIQMKLNELLELLFDRCKYFLSLGIPVVAGVPLCSSLEDFHTNTPCMWFEVPSTGFECIIKIDLKTNQASDQTFKLDSDGIVQLIEHKGKFLSWTRFREIIKEIGQDNRWRGNYWNRMSGDLYKPVYPSH